MDPGSESGMTHYMCHFTIKTAPVIIHAKGGNNVEKFRRIFLVAFFSLLGSMIALIFAHPTGRRVLGIFFSWETVVPTLLMSAIFALTFLAVERWEARKPPRPRCSACGQELRGKPKIIEPIMSRKDWAFVVVMVLFVFVSSRVLGIP